MKNLIWIFCRKFLQLQKHLMGFPLKVTALWGNYIENEQNIKFEKNWTIHSSHLPDSPIISIIIVHRRNHNLIFSLENSSAAKDILCSFLVKLLISEINTVFVPRSLLWEGQKIFLKKRPRERRKWFFISFNFSLSFLPSLFMPFERKTQWFISSAWEEQSRMVGTTSTLLHSTHR